MTNYKIQDGCHNCKSCYVWEPYDDPLRYHCTLTKKYEKPAKPDVEPHLLDFEKLAEEGYKFEKWIFHLSQVEPAGICENYEKMRD